MRATNFFDIVGMKEFINRMAYAVFGRVTQQPRERGRGVKHFAGLRILPDQVGRIFSDEPKAFFARANPRFALAAVGDVVRDKANHLRRVGCVLPQRIVISQQPLIAVRGFHAHRAARVLGRCDCF